MLSDLKKIVENSGLKNVYLTSAGIVSADNYNELLAELFQQAGIGFGVCVFFYFLFTFNLHVTMLCVASLALCYVDFYAALYWWGMDINLVVLPSLMMSLALVSLLHFNVAYSFVNFQSGEPADRLSEAVRRSVPGVFHSVFQTLIVVLLLIPTSSAILVIYFKLWVFLLVYGMLHAVVLLPTLLGLCGSKVETSNQPPLEVTTYEPVSKHEVNTKPF